MRAGRSCISTASRASKACTCWRCRPAARRNPEKHIYDEFFLVIEGRGTTEVWRGDGKKQVFEWQAGTLFMIPVNASYRLVNATGSPALAGRRQQRAAGAFNIFQSHRFIFDNDWDFRERFDMSDDFFKPKSDLEMEPVRGRAAIRSNVFPDIVNCRAAARQSAGAGLSPHPADLQRLHSGRRHRRLHLPVPERPLLQGPLPRSPARCWSVCAARATRTTGRSSLGPTPWQDGKGDQVRMLEYVPGGLVAAAPGGGNWFHQHFGVGTDPLRVINYWGGPHARWGIADEKDDDVKAGNLFGIHEGGRTILYHEEDPFIRDEFRRRLTEDGVEFTMPASAFEVPHAATPWRQVSSRSWSSGLTVGRV